MERSVEKEGGRLPAFSVRDSPVRIPSSPSISINLEEPPSGPDALQNSFAIETNIASFAASVLSEGKHVASAASSAFPQA